MLQTLERRIKYIDAILSDRHTLKTGSTVILKITKKKSRSPRNDKKALQNDTIMPSNLHQYCFKVKL